MFLEFSPRGTQIVLTIIESVEPQLKCSSKSVDVYSLLFRISPWFLYSADMLDPSVHPIDPNSYYPFNNGRDCISVSKVVQEGSSAMYTPLCTL